jgi:hypothetical protein
MYRFRRARCFHLHGGVETDIVGSTDTLTSKDSNLVLSPFFVHLINLRYKVRGMTDKLTGIGISYVMEIKAQETKVMIISRQPSPVQIMIGQKQLENVEYVNCLGSMITNDARCTCEIKSRTAMAKATFNKKTSLFTTKLDLNLRKKLVKCYICSTALYGVETLDIFESRSKISGNI